MTGVNLRQAVARHRTLVVEGCDGAGRAELTTELARQGFTIRRSPPYLHHVDPTRPYREILQGPGRFALDGGLVGELVYGPLRQGRSRVTWIQALDFAEAVAERAGAFVHLTAPLPVLRERLAARGAGAADLVDIAAAATAYERVFATLAQHVPIVTVGEGERAVRPSLGPGPAAPASRSAAASSSRSAGSVRPARAADQAGTEGLPRIRAPAPHGCQPW
jgi:hypothetical protein